MNGLPFTDLLDNYLDAKAVFDRCQNLTPEQISPIERHSLQASYEQARQMLNEAYERIIRRIDA